MTYMNIVRLTIQRRLGTVNCHKTTVFSVFYSSVYKYRTSNLCCENDQRSTCGNNNHKLTQLHPQVALFCPWFVSGIGLVVLFKCSVTSERVDSTPRLETLLQMFWTRSLHQSSLSASLASITGMMCQCYTVSYTVFLRQ